MTRGRLLVGSGAINAELFLDGRRLAVTPASLPDVSAGTHAIELRAGSLRVLRKVEIRAGHTTYLEVKLAPRLNR